MWLNIEKNTRFLFNAVVITEEQKWARKGRHNIQMNKPSKTNHMTARSNNERNSYQVPNIINKLMCLSRFEFLFRLKYVFLILTVCILYS